MIKETPFTGKSYLESINDNREVWIYGQKAKNLPNNPAFRNSSRSIARMYDLLHNDDDIKTSVDNENGSFTHPFFKPFLKNEDLILSRKAIETWQKSCYGWMGRSPDYKGSFIGTIPIIKDYLGEFSSNAQNWYNKCQNKVLFLNHATVNPPIDRHLEVEKIRDVFIHVDKEVDGGLIISGAKVVATGSALTNYNYVSNFNFKSTNKENRLIFIAPMDTEGLKLICRPSYEIQSSTVGSPLDYPLSSRFDENDAILIFDKAFIPWENVIAYDDGTNKDIISGMMNSGFSERVSFHSSIRLGIKLDFICGLFLKSIECSGTNVFRGVQREAGQIIAYRNMVWAMVDSMTYNPDKGINNSLIPNHDAAMAFRVLSTNIISTVRNIIFQKVGSNFIYLNSNVVDTKNEHINQYLEKYLRGSNGYTYSDRVKLMKLFWDALGSEFASRHELYEMSYTGNDDVIRVETLLNAERRGNTDYFKSLVDNCLNEYDFDGWKVKDFINPNDINIWMKK